MFAVAYKNAKCVLKKNMDFENKSSDVKNFYFIDISATLSRESIAEISVKYFFYIIFLFSKCMASGCYYF